MSGTRATLSTRAGSPDRELWIDGQSYVVQHEVWAHFQFLGDLVSRLTDAVEAASGALVVKNRTGVDPNVARWSAGRKATLISAIATGLLARTEALRMFRISEEELREWERRYALDGLKGLLAQRPRVSSAQPQSTAS